MSERPERLSYGRRRARDEDWLVPFALRYVGDAIVYLADVLRERETPEPVIHVHVEATEPNPTPVIRCGWPECPLCVHESDETPSSGATVPPEPHTAIQSPHIQKENP